MTMRIRWVWTTEAWCAVLGLGLAGFACAGAEQTDCDDRCGSLIVTTVGGVETLAPIYALTSDDLNAGDQIFLKLAEISADRNTLDESAYQPRLARAWDRLDSLTLRFHLDQRATWDDGTPVSARDVVFTFGLYSNPEANSPHGSAVSHIAEVTASDDSTVIVRFDRAYPEQFFDASFQMRILPAHLLDTIPPGELQTHALLRQPIGNGPYRFVRWRGDLMPELAAKPDFFLGAPGIARITWQVVENGDAAINLLTSGQSDALEFLGSPATVERIRAVDHLRVYPYDFPYYYYIAFNYRDPDDPSRPHPVFGDRAVRRAITMATNRERVARATFGESGVVPPGPMSQVVPIWERNDAEIPFDTAGARRLLAEAGWSDTNGDGVLEKGSTTLEFEILFPGSSGARRDAATLIRDQLARVGIRATPQASDPSSVLDRAQSGQFDAHFGSWGGDPTPVGIVLAWTSEGEQNFSRYENPEFDRLAIAASQAASPDESRRQWRDAMRIILADAPAMWVMTGSQAGAVHTRFEDVTVPSHLFYANVWQWRVREGQFIERDLIASR